MLHHLKVVLLRSPAAILCDASAALNQCSTNFILSWDAVNSHIIILTNGPDRPSHWAGEKKNELSLWLARIRTDLLPNPEKIMHSKITVISSLNICLTRAVFTYSAVHYTACAADTQQRFAEFDATWKRLNITHKVRTIFGSIHLFFLFHVMTAVIIFHQRMSLVGVSLIFHSGDFFFPLFPPRDKMWMISSENPSLCALI